MLIDAHCHLDDARFKDPVQVAEAAKAAGVIAIVNQGINLESDKRTLELAKCSSIVKPSLGFYPVDILKSTPEQITATLAFIEQHAKEAVCIGEIGLDDYHIKGRLEEQKVVFGKLMEIALAHNLPVSIHSRDAELETIEFLESFAYKRIVMHCFGGSVKLVERIKRNGWHMSIPVSVVYDQHFQRIVELMPLSHLLTETDAPYLGPKKGETNVPQNVLLSIEKFAQIKKMEPQEVANIVFSNYQNLFLC